jgi:hypothetical protein
MALDPRYSAEMTLPTSRAQYLAWWEASDGSVRARVTPYAGATPDDATVASGVPRPSVAVSQHEDGSLVVYYHAADGSIAGAVSHESGASGTWAAL